MALVNITPVMTGNTTPSPYVASASSIFSTAFDAWKAFNGTNLNSDDSWITANNTNNGWIMLDFGSPIKIDAISMVGRNEPTVTANPKDFALYGSNNGIEFNLIDTFTNQILWTQTEWRLYKLKQQVCFRYYKVIITSNNGLSSYLAIGDIKFWQDNTAVSYTTNQNALHAQCLPKNSTVNMKNRQNDPREGLLGFANDVDDNYGTMWLIDNKGKAMIPKAGLASPQLLFYGTAVQGSEISMSESYANYSYLYMVINLPSYTGQQANMLISNKIIADKIALYNYYVANSPTVLNDANAQKQMSLMFKTGNDSSFTSYIYIYFKSEKILYVPILTLTSVTPVYLSIYGVK